MVSCKVCIFLTILEKDHLEVNFVQKESTKKMHVTSNPYFSFHDDVFPVFSKNSFAQPRFPRPGGPRSKTIVPDSFFSSLEALKHISTVELTLNETETFQLEMYFGVRNIFNSF